MPWRDAGWCSQHPTGSRHAWRQLLSEDERGLPRYGTTIEGTAGNKATKPIL